MINWMANTLDVYIWDVGHGLSVTVITPYIYSTPYEEIKRRRVVQIDAGANNKYNFSPMRNLVDKHNLQVIDWLILSHPDKDHIDDLVNLANLRAGGRLNVLNLLRNATVPLNEISDDVFEECEAKTHYKNLHMEYSAPVLPQNFLTPANFGGLEVNSSFLPYKGNKDFNNASVVVNIKFGGVNILIPGDLEGSGATELIQSNSLISPGKDTIKILVAPHHGSETADPAELLKFFSPNIVLASAEEGIENTDGLYSDSQYVTGLEIELSSGLKERHRFCGTKGETFHISTFGQYPNIKKISYRPVSDYSFDDILRKAMELRARGYT